MTTRGSVAVTGAAGGIGHATVLALLDAGFDVRPIVRRVADADRLATELDLPVACADITDEASVRQAADDITAEGGLVGLVNVAGAALPGPLEHLSPDQLARQLDVNVTGQLRVTQALLPALRAGARRHGHARIVMMGSLDARVVGPLFGPYGASKCALVGLSDALRCELHHERIGVVVLEPGVVATPIWRRGTAVLARMQEALPDRGGQWAPLMDFARRRVSTRSERGADPRHVGAAVVSALTTRSPAHRQLVGIRTRVIAATVRIAPARAVHLATALPARWSAARYRHQTRRSRRGHWDGAGSRATRHR